MAVMNVMMMHQKSKLQWTAQMSVIEMTRNQRMCASKKPFRHQDVGKWHHHNCFAKGITAERSSAGEASLLLFVVIMLETCFSALALHSQEDRSRTYC